MSKILFRASILRDAPFVPSPSGAKVEQGTRGTGHCLAAKHTKELQIFLRLVERNFACSSGPIFPSRVPSVTKAAQQVR